MSGNHERALDALLRRGRLRALETPHGIDFTSNDYLGLAQSRELADAIVQAIARGVPVGAGGSRLLRGNHPEHEALEARSGAVLRRRNGAVLRRRLHRQHRAAGDVAIARRPDRLRRTHPCERSRRHAPFEGRCGGGPPQRPAERRRCHHGVARGGRNGTAVDRCRKPLQHGRRPRAARRPRGDRCCATMPC